LKSLQKRCRESGKSAQAEIDAGKIYFTSLNNQINLPIYIVAIQSKTKAMVAAEESDSEEDGPEIRPKKKSKTNSLPVDDLDDEEASLVAAIAPAADVYDDSFDMDDNFNNGGLSEEDRSLHDTDKGEENGEDDEMGEMEHGDEGRLGDFGGGVDNGVSSVVPLFSDNLNCYSQIEVKEEEDVKPLAKVQSKRMKTPSKTRVSSTKVKEDDFSPRMRCLAIASKNYIHELTALKTPFPLDNEDEREEYIWTMIQETAQTKSIYENAFNDAQNNPELHSLWLHLYDHLLPHSKPGIL
jgi:hypothetical protein